MKQNRVLSVILVIVLCFMFIQPYTSAEEMPENGIIPEGWIRITYFGDEMKAVMIPAGCAIANLWEPETVRSSKFLYWTTNGADPLNEEYRVTEKTVFYKNTNLRAVTENTPAELEKQKEFLDNWHPSGTEQETERTTERDWDYYIIHFYECDENNQEHEIHIAKDLNKEERMIAINDITEMVEERKGWKFAGWYTEENGGGKKITGEKKIKSDMVLYAYWVDDECYTITFMKNYGKGEQFVAEMNVEESKAKFTSGPKVPRKGYKITGWYTKPKGGKKVEIGAKLTRDITLYAHWEKVKVKKVSIKQIYGEDKAITVKYKKQTGVKGYQVQISTSKKFAKKNTITKTYNNKKVFKRTIKKLKKGQTYYLRIRAYKKDSAGRKVYGKWSEVKKIKTK